jgi:predicted nucleotidyltransferase
VVTGFLLSGRREGEVFEAPLRGITAVEPEGRFHPGASDLDFLVEFLPLEPGQHADAYFDLLFALEDLFGSLVDLVMTEAIRNPYFRESIERSRKQLYAA